VIRRGALTTLNSPWPQSKADAQSVDSAGDALVKSSFAQAATISRWWRCCAGNPAAAQGRWWRPLGPSARCGHGPATRRRAGRRCGPGFGGRSARSDGGIRCRPACRPRPTVPAPGRCRSPLSVSSIKASASSRPMLSIALWRTDSCIVSSALSFSKALEFRVPHSGRPLSRPRRERQLDFRHDQRE